MKKFNKKSIRITICVTLFLITAFSIFSINAMLCSQLTQSQYAASVSMEPSRPWNSLHEKKTKKTEPIYEFSDDSWLNAKKARDKTIKKELYTCIPNQGHFSIIHSIIQGYEDDLYTSSYTRPLNRSLLFHLPIFNIVDLVENYHHVLIDTQIKKWQNELSSSICSCSIRDVENALKNGALASRSIPDFFSIHSLKKIDLNIVKLLFTEGLALPSATLGLGGCVNLYLQQDVQFMQFLLKNGKKINTENIAESLDFAVACLKPEMVELFLEHKKANSINSTNKNKNQEENENKRILEIILERFHGSIKYRKSEEIEKASSILKTMARFGFFDSMHSDMITTTILKIIRRFGFFDHDKTPAIHTIKSAHEIIEIGRRERI